MGALDAAMAEVRRKEALELEKAERDAAESKHNDAERKRLAEKIDQMLSEFHGVNGMYREGNCLFKNRHERKTLIAKIEIKWETWENPNYDYKVEESGIVARYTVEGDPRKYFGCHNYDKGETGTCEGSHGAEYFGKAMARHL